MENQSPVPQIKPTKYPLTCTMIFTGLAAFIGGSFIFGWNITCISPTEGYIRQFMSDSAYHNYGTEISEDMLNILFSLATALYTVGCVIGAFFAGKLADRYGRKKSILGMHSVGILGAIFYGICQRCVSLELLMAARFSVGLGAGACFAIVPMYANEIAPAHLRGAISTCSQLFITLGIFIASIFLLEETLGSAEWWPLGAACMVIFSVISVVMLLMPQCVESPKWLLNIKKDEEAGKRALQKLYNLENVDELLAAIQSESQADSEDVGKQEKWGYLRLLRTSNLRWPVLLVVCLNASQQFSGINVVFCFASSLYKSAGLYGSWINYAALLVSLVNFLATIPSTILIDRLGRLPLLRYPMAGMILMMILETIFLSIRPKETWMSFASITCMVIYVVCFEIGLGPVPLFIGSELLRPEPRASAMSLGGAVNQCCALSVALLFQTVLQRLLGDLALIPFIILTTLFLILFWFKLPETRGKSIEEIYQQLGIVEQPEPASPEKPLDNDLEIRLHNIDTVFASPVNYSEMATPDRFSLSSHVSEEPIIFSVRL